MRRHPPSGRHGYGVKGGTSATAGRKAANYQVLYPDGTSEIVRSFKANGAESCPAWVYYTEYAKPGTRDPESARWVCACVRDERYEGELSHMTRVIAKRI